MFISGDGAGWIKSGAEYIPNTRYIMDGFHLKQAIYGEAGADEDNRAALAEAIWAGKWAEMNRLLISFLVEAQWIRAVENVIRYLNNNWSGIRARQATKTCWSAPVQKVI
ncbi:MAG: hypothetical protein GX335_01315 [Firmicutes bacterium]|nr:hypothetical protein [Bacillota bacterium]